MAQVHTIHCITISSDTFSNFYFSNCNESKFRKFLHFRRPVGCIYRGLWKAQILFSGDRKKNDEKKTCIPVLSYACMQSKIGDKFCSIIYSCQFIHTRCDQKVRWIIFFFKKYLFIHQFLFCPLQSNPPRI